jgi:hypothetical protein
MTGQLGEDVYRRSEIGTFCRIEGQMPDPERRVIPMDEFEYRSFQYSHGKVYVSCGGQCH